MVTRCDVNPGSKWCEFVEAYLGEFVILLQLCNCLGWLHSEHVSSSSVTSSAMSLHGSGHDGYFIFECKPPHGLHGLGGGCNTTVT